MKNDERKWGEDRAHHEHNDSGPVCETADDSA